MSCAVSRKAQVLLVMSVADAVVVVIIVSAVGQQRAMLVVVVALIVVTVEVVVDAFGVVAVGVVVGVGRRSSSSRCGNGWRTQVLPVLSVALVLQLVWRMLMAWWCTS